MGYDAALDSKLRLSIIFIRMTIPIARYSLRRCLSYKSATTSNSIVIAYRHPMILLRLIVSDCANGPSGTLQHSQRRIT
jgi:hypothetical protein